MNNRIKELADKFWAEEYWNKPNTDKLLPAQLNKFAELIVRKCIEVVEDSDGYNQYFPHVTENIKEHFGVEE